MASASGIPRRWPLPERKPRLEARLEEIRRELALAEARRASALLRSPPALPEDADG